MRSFIIAEISANHNQSYALAERLVYAAKYANADAVKVQMFTPDQMTEDDENIRIESGPWKGKLYDLYKKAYTPTEWIPKLQKVAKELGLEFFATVYHPDMVAKAEEFGIPIYKIASFEVPYLDLIEEIAKTKKPVIMSTGMADFNEIKRAVNIVKKHHDDITLLKCTSEYPAPIEGMNLKTIPALKHRFKCKVGLSDHTTSIVVPVVAVAMGAEVIEKHLKATSKCLDSAFSILPEKFKTMVQIVRAAEKAVGKVVYGGKKNYRRKLVNGRMIRVVT